LIHTTQIASAVAVAAFTVAVIVITEPSVKAILAFQFFLVFKPPALFIYFATPAFAAGWTSRNLGILFPILFLI
jgi:hypothetical protein